jgi:hypothetical protein
LWQTSEHYFQAQKFLGHPKHMKEVFNAKGPMQAALMGRDKKRPLRQYWEYVKDEIMYNLSDSDLCILLRYCEEYNIFDKDGNVNRNRLKRLFSENK